VATGTAGGVVLFDRLVAVCHKSDWFARYRETLTMVEAGCTGQGSNRTERVPWTKALSDGELAKFVDLSYISGDGWLDAQPR